MTKSVKNKKFYEFWIALRYTNLKNTNQFISFITDNTIINAITPNVMPMMLVKEINEIN